MPTTFKSFAPFTNLATGKALSYPDTQTPEVPILYPRPINEADPVGDGTVFQCAADYDTAINMNWNAMGWRFRTSGTLKLPPGIQHGEEEFAWDTGWLTITSAAQDPGRNFSYDHPTFDAETGFIRKTFTATVSLGIFNMAHEDLGNPPTYQDDAPTDIELFAVISGIVYFDRWKFHDLHNNPADFYAWTEIAYHVFIVPEDNDPTWQYFYENAGGPKSVFLASNIISSPADLAADPDDGFNIVRTWTGGAYSWEENVRIYRTGSQLGEETPSVPSGALNNLGGPDSDVYEFVITLARLESTEMEGPRSTP